MVLQIESDCRSEAHNSEGLEKEELQKTVKNLELITSFLHEFDKQLHHGLSHDIDPEFSGFLLEAMVKMMNIDFSSRFAGFNDYLLIKNKDNYSKEVLIEMGDGFEKTVDYTIKELIRSFERAISVGNTDSVKRAIAVQNDLLTVFYRSLIDNGALSLDIVSKIIDVIIYQIDIIIADKGFAEKVSINEGDGEEYYVFMYEFTKNYLNDFIKSFSKDFVIIHQQNK